MKKVKLSISGMHCASCASNIERALKKVSGIKEVSVSVVTNKAFASIEDKVSEEEMKKAVAKAGYKLVNIEEQ